MSMPLSMPPTLRCAAAEVWMALSIAPPAQDCWRSASPWEAARPERRLTRGYQLKAHYVIHTVGPVYSGGRQGEAALLSSCYRESLRLAADAGMQSVAFPCISAGIYGYPQQEACKIALAAVRAWLCQHELPGSVIFCCYLKEDARLYRMHLTE